MIFDCFTFFNENDIFELKFNIEKNYVDKFLVVEATKTFAGNSKPLNFDISRFESIKDKIIYVVLDNIPEFESPWFYEDYQRNFIFEALKNNNCQENDIVIISDVDEIISEKAVKIYQQNPIGIKSIEQIASYYYLNYQSIGNDWYAPRILTFKEFFNKDNFSGYESKMQYLESQRKDIVTPNQIRLKNNCSVIRDGGWHFSFMGGEDAIIKKIKAYSHQEFNQEKYLNKNYLKKCILGGKDIFNRKGYYFLPVEIDNSFPQYIQENQEKFSNLIFEIPKNKKLLIKLRILLAKFKKNLYSKRKDGTRRILKLFFITFSYDKNTKK